MKRLLTLILILCGVVWSQTAVFNGNTVLSGNTVIPFPQATPPPIGASLFTLEEHNISDSNAYPTIPFGLYRQYGTSCQWNNMWTGAGDNYNFTCFGQQLAYAHTFNVPLMFTFGQVPSGLSTINPDNMTGAPAQFPVAINGVTENCTGGTCTATVTTLQRLNAGVGVSPGVTLTGATGCPENPNGTFITTAVNNGTNYPWTYTFNIGAGTVSSSGCGGVGMTLADNAQTATRCGGTGSAVGGQNGGCYAPNDLNEDGSGTDAHLISFLTQLLAYDNLHDPTHTLVYIEAWNEPQGPGFFNGSIAQMARMMKDMYTVIQASPQATYLQFASTAPSGGLTSPASYLGLLGADPSNPFQYVCCIDNHTYNYPPGAGTPDPMSAITIASNVRAAISPFPSAVGKPQLATEGSWGFGPFGASTTNLGPNTGTAAGGDKAGWVVDAYMAHQCAGYSAYSFFAWDQQCHTGLACATPPPPYSIDPAGVAYGIAHDWLVGANVTQSCTKDGSGNWTLKLQRGSYNATALWNACLTSSCTLGNYTIPAGVYTDYRDISGNINGITPTQTTVPVQFDPILLESTLPPLNIFSSATLPSATLGLGYSATISATTVGASPYTWKEVNIPSVLASIGLGLTGATGGIVKVTGTPTATGTYHTQIRVQDANSQTYAQNITITVNATGLQITSGSPPNGQQGVNYGPGGTGFPFAATGGVLCSGHYNWVNIGVTIPGLDPINATSGLYGPGPPTVPGTYAVNMQVTDCNTPPTSVATGPLNVTITAATPPLSGLTTSCPNGTQGSAYLCQLMATGGISPYFWSVFSGAIPTNTTLTTSSSVGNVAGTPNTPQTVNPVFQVTDSTPITPLTALVPPTGSFSIVISPTPPPTNRDNQYTPFSGGACVPTYGSSSDAGALTPTRCQNSQRVNRPCSTCSTVTLGVGGNLQTALNAATCGETLKLTAGATYGHVVAPTLNCSVTNWFTITTTDSSLLPPEGTRITPCLTGLGSLPGRPSYSCPVPIAALGNIQNTSSGNLFDMSVNPVSFWQFIGVQFSNACAAPCTGSVSLVVLGAGAHDIVFDQVVENGEEGTFPQTTANKTETQRGIGLSQSKNVMVVDSYFYDFYCLSNIGSCSDAQAISGGSGSVSSTLWGNYKIVNDFLEASGEDILFGGGGGPGPNPCQPTCVDDSPADIEARINHFFKPLQWEPPLGTVGNPPPGFPTVKNHWECKNCERAFLEGNIMDNVWSGFSQNAYSLVLGPKNQQSGTVGICPNCSVHDVIFRYNLVHGGANFLQFANGKSDPPASALAFQGYGYSVHDNVVDNLLNPSICWGTSGSFCAGFVTYQISEDINMNVTSDVLHNISILHNTTVVAGTAAPQPAGLLGLSGTTTASGFGLNNIVFNNNLGSQAQSGTINVIGGGSAQCAFGVTAGINMIQSCWGVFPPSSFSGNDIVQSTAIWGASQCLSEPTFTSIFVNYNNGLNGDYHVKPSSACFSFSSGANVDLVNSNTAGVQ